MRSPRPDLSTAVWRKSSYSNSDGGNCVEVARNDPTIVPVRDSKHLAAPALIIAAPAWTAFISHLKG
ncbi:DUF397 domain-containing protein [Streptomyces ureilyticus]|uniref:DUF397 domain-containing protein n=1 Tax=Streptomyces ureilyticus TaxID=1775131 RepID=A0ABX0DJB8_9ACTN|nr:DUF397 domain-containing protein [Streptomyces ureilyticus]NGO41931.1 DUF397 domain-containing protein [Streptomyces ureilyticus]